MKNTLKFSPYKIPLLVSVFILLFTGIAFAQNPIIRNQFTADPSARVFNDKIYVYPSHDIMAIKGKGRPGWFCMEDYHVFSSDNLTQWTDHGVIVSQNKVPWADSTGFSMWAPDCIFRNGKYYFYFPAPAKDTALGRGFSVGVAISENPTGPFVPQLLPIKNVHGIDPNPFIGKDGQAYLYWAQGKIYMAKLKDNMLELASEPQVVMDLPGKGLIEGPYLFERNGIYYMTYPHVQNKIERLEYAIGDNPMGPFKFAGVIMDESPMNCWTNHQSFIVYKGQWYLFYHQNAYSPKFDKNRSVCIDSLFFNTDGKIQKVMPGLRGVGLTSAVENIEIDRYSLMAESGVSVAFLDTLHPFNGWKVKLDKKSAWVQYNSVDFGPEKLKSVFLKVLSPAGSSLEIRLDKPDGLRLAEVNIPSGTEWATIKAKVSHFEPGVHHLVIILTGESAAEIDWIKFVD